MPVTANFTGPVQTDAMNRFRMLQSMVGIEQSLSQSIASGGAAVPIAFTAAATVDANTDGMWASGNPTRLTAPITGKYVVIYTVNHDALGSGTGSVTIRLRKNGTTTFTTGWGQYPNNVTINPSVTSCTIPLPLSAGDYIEVIFSQTNSGATALNIDNAAFGMLYVGE